MDVSRNRFLRRCCIASLLAALATGCANAPEVPPIFSRVETAPGGGRILTQEVRIDAPVARVWAAYTTSEGYTAWAAPKAEIDLRPGGTIRSQYDPEAEIGDPGTITLHILNVVPERVLTLQAEASDRWPAAMQADAEHLMNVVLFDEIDADRTRIRSYGVGYGDQSAYDEMMGFFIEANEGLFRALKAHLEAP